MVVWRCPACGSAKNVVCPVCGRDKKPGQTCPECGSEYTYTTCPACGHREQHGKEPESQSYPEKLRLVLQQRGERYLTYYELMRLAALLHPESLPALAKVEPVEVKHITARAFSEPEGFAERLTALPGMERSLAKLIEKELRV